jgi:hypothetical protein
MKQFGYYTAGLFYFCPYGKIISRYKEYPGVTIAQ